MKVESYWNRKELASRRGLDAVRAYVQHSGSLSLTHHPSRPRHPAGSFCAENAERGRLKNLTVSVQVLSTESSGIGRVGGETPATREAESRLCPFEKQRGRR